MRDGKSRIVDVPAPIIRPGTVLVQNAASLVSAGTERMVVDFARKNLISKARSRPDLIRQVLDKAKREGILPTIEAAFNRLDQPMPLGYSCAGTILEVGLGVSNFKPGDRVACAGGNYASHAEIVVVPANLVTPIAESLDFDSAAFTTLGAIALHGFRLAHPQLGERVAIVGLGLLGLLAAQISRSAGCSTFGIDLDPSRLELAKGLGIPSVIRQQAEEASRSFTQGMGFDVVLVCADARSSDPVELAGDIAADRGRVIAVGAFGLIIPRKTYYNKELFFQVSRSYGPGRYDPNYEEKGQDYPAGYVRWTEGRNLRSFSELMEQKKVDVKPLITHRFPIEQAEPAYDLITGKSGEPFLGVLIQYPQTEAVLSHSIQVAPRGTASTENQIRLGVLGAGNYANAVFLPVIKKSGVADPVVIASASGVSARHAAERFGYARACSQEEEVLGDPDVNTVVILTQHNHHTRQVIGALRNGKHVYCEKPIALNHEELVDLASALSGVQGSLLAAGFNRRFAYHAVELKKYFSERREPLVAHYRVNAGYLPLTHWLHDPRKGGGRIIGEGCHFIDFLTFLVGEPPVSVVGCQMPDSGRYCQDNVVLTFHFPDGSLGTLSYLSNGNRSVSKERVEVFCSGKIGILDDFRRLELVDEKSSRVMKSSFRQDKGHARSWAAFLKAIQNKEQPPISYTHLFSVAEASFAAVKTLETGSLVHIQQFVIDHW